MKISRYFIQAFGYAMANRIDVACFGPRLSFVQMGPRGREPAVEARQIAVKPGDYEMRRGCCPFDGAKKNSQTFSSKLYGCGDTRLRLYGIFDCGRQNGVFYYSDDHAAGCEIRDNFLTRCVLPLLRFDRPRNENQKHRSQSAENQRQ